MKLGILGGGSWGTALAILWARHGHEVDLWVRNDADAARYRKQNRNTKYLAEAVFPEKLHVTADLATTLARNNFLCLAIPLQAYRSFLTEIAGSLSADHELLILSKGIELETHLLPTRIILDVLGADREDKTFTLSGPSFAKEVAQDKPTTVVLAGKQRERLRELQTALNCATFRMYRNRDVTGVELCASLKNVIAIASGMASGLNLGHNAIAGLITRGLSEIARLGVRLGAQRETFAGLAGMGDLILTCTGSLSRNLRVGLALAEGHDLETILEDLGMVAEGVHTCRSAFQLGQSLDVELPITEAVHRILYENLPPKVALQKLMSRRLKAEVQ